jgi:hypothetical protein
MAKPARKLPLARCRGCNASICWGEAADGTRIPLEPRRASAFRILDQAASHVAVERVEDVYISHFLTCPKRDQFSGRGRASTTNPT